MDGGVALMGAMQGRNARSNRKAAKDVSVVPWSMAADEPARPRPTAERAGTDIVRVQPTAKQFAVPNQPDVSTGEVMALVQNAMLAAMPFTGLRDAILAHPTMAEGLGGLFSNVPAR
jgi:hypothetical protein